MINRRRESLPYSSMEGFALDIVETLPILPDEMHLPPLQPWPPYPVSLNSDVLFPRGILVSESPELCPHPDIRSNEHDTSFLLDTKMWQDPSQDLTSSYAPPGSYRTAVNHTSPPYLAGRSNDPQNNLAMQRIFTADEKSQAALQERQAQCLNLDRSRYIEDQTHMFNDEMQHPAMLYRCPDDKSPPYRRFSRACAINVAGLWVDKDDLYYGIGQGKDKISVHECRWATSSDPCGMWMIASRPRVGAHIRQWHSRRDVEGAVACVWDGCTANRAMHKDSINRHVVTVHLGEGFQCNGCNQEFSRKDVYDRHILKGESCKNSGAATVYGTEHRVIDIQQALRGGGAVHYAT